jgi:hypothetical protein
MHRLATGHTSAAKIVKLIRSLAGSPLYRPWPHELRDVAEARPLACTIHTTNAIFFRGRENSEMDGAHRTKRLLDIDR